MAKFSLNPWKKDEPTEKKGIKKYPKQYAQRFFQHIGFPNYNESRDGAYIEEGYQKNPVIQSIIGMTQDHLCKARWYVCDKDGNEIEHPWLSPLLYNPNQWQSWTEFLKESVMFKMLFGNSYIWGIPRTGGIGAGPQYLVNLPPEEINIIPTADLMAIAGYELDFAWSRESMIEASEVLHLKDPNPEYDGDGAFLYGQSKLRAGLRSLQTHNEAIDSIMWFQQNRGAQKLLMAKGEDPDDLSPEAEQGLKNLIRNRSQGPRNTGNLDYIDMELDVLDVSANAAEAMLTELKDTAAMDLANIYNFPHSLLGLKDTTYQNGKEAKKGLWENVIIPYLKEFTDGFNYMFAPMFGKDVYLKFDLTAVDALQEDKLMRGKAIKEFAGAITINEARKMAGLREYDWMKEPTTMDEFRDQLYLGFTQAVVSDQEEISDTNNNQDNGGTNTEDS